MVEVSIGGKTASQIVSEGRAAGISGYVSIGGKTASQIVSEGRAGGFSSSRSIAKAIARQKGIVKAKAVEEARKKEAERKRLEELERLRKERIALTQKQAVELTRLKRVKRIKRIERIRGVGEYVSIGGKTASQIVREGRAGGFSSSRSIAKAIARQKAIVAKKVPRELFIEERKVQEEIKEKTPVNIFSRKSWREFGVALRKSKSQKDRSLGKKILTEPLLFASMFVRRTLEVQDLPAGVLVLIKDPRNIKHVPAGVVEDLKGTVQLLKTSPSEGVAKIGADIFTFRIIGGTLKATGKLTSSATAKVFPSFRGVKTSALGVRTLEKLKKVKKIEIIKPRGVRLKVKPKAAVREAKIPLQLKETPRLAPVSQVEKRILKIVKKRKDAVSGSYAQESFLKKQFTRKHKDLDILTKNRPKLMKELKKEFGKDIKFKKKKVSVEVIYKKKPVADLVDFKLGEEGFVRKYGVRKVGGVDLVVPEARLAAKVRQFGVGKRGKVLRDIELLYGKKVSLKKPAIEGAYGFTRKELEAYIGKKGPLTTAQQDLFKSLREQLKGPKSFDPKEILKAQSDLIKKKVFTAKELKNTRWLYATPPKKGVAQVRVSRLGLSSGKEATLREFLRGQVSFKKGKSAIYVFPKEKIFASAKKLTKAKTIKTPKGFVVPYFTHELEVVLGKGWIIKRGKRLGTRIIEGNKVKIYELKKIKIPKTIKSDLKKLGNLYKKTAAKKFKKGSKAGKELVRKIDSKEKLLNTKLKKSTGFDYFSKVKKPKKYYPLKRKVTARVIRKVPRVPKRPSKRIPRRPPRKPPRRPPKRIPRRPPRKPPKRIPRRPPERIPRAIVERRPPTEPRRRPPKKPPRKPPKKPPAIKVKKKIVKPKKKKPPVQSFNVYGKSGKKFVKLNVKPLTKDDAFSQGAFAIDHTTSKSFKIVPVGKVKKTGTLRKGERNYFKRAGYKFREHKVKKGRKFLIKPRYIEKGKYGIDTRGEKKGLSLAKFLKQRRVGRVKRKPVRRAPTRSKIRVVIKKAPKGQKPTRWRFKGNQRLGFRNNKVVEIVEFKPGKKSITAPQSNYNKRLKKSIKRKATPTQLKNLAKARKVLKQKRGRRG